MQLSFEKAGFRDRKLNEVGFLPLLEVHELVESEHYLLVQLLLYDPAFLLVLFSKLLSEVVDVLAGE